MCNFPNCKTRSIYNFDGESTPLYCMSHKLDGMCNIVSKRCCHISCRTQPTFNYSGENKSL